MHDTISTSIPLQSVLNATTKQAEEINSLTNWFFIAAAFIMLVVLTFTVYVIMRFNADKRRNKEKKELSRKWEIPMIGIPSAMIIVFLVYSIITMGHVLPDNDNSPPDLIVIAHQWWWEARYPDYKVVTANEIHLPAQRNLKIQLQSADVIHDWWVPSFGNKMDMIPGRLNYIHINVKKPGVYYGTCSEFCGRQHAQMRLIIVAEKNEDYLQWLSQQQRDVVMESATLPGAALFIREGCGSCHTIKGTPANGDRAPELTHLASRKTLLTGLVPNDSGELAGFIKAPHFIKPGINMPDFRLPDSTVRKLAGYLSCLK